MKLEITEHTPDRIKGVDEKGHFVMVRETVHTDGTPDEWEKVYYTPCPDEKEGESGYDYNVQNPCDTCKNVGDCEPCEKMREGE